MGNKNSAKTESNELTEEQIETLMSETGLDRDEILKWYNEFKQVKRLNNFLNTL